MGKEKYKITNAIKVKFSAYNRMQYIFCEPHSTTKGKLAVVTQKIMIKLSKHITKSHQITKESK